MRSGILTHYIVVIILDFPCLVKGKARFRLPGGGRKSGGLFRQLKGLISKMNHEKQLTMWKITSIIWGGTDKIVIFVKTEAIIFP